MTSTIQNFNRFIGHIRAEQTVSGISKSLEQFIATHSSNYPDGFIDEYVGVSKNLLDQLSMKLLKMAEDELIHKEDFVGKPK